LTSDTISKVGIGNNYHGQTKKKTLIIPAGARHSGKKTGENRVDGESEPDALSEIGPLAGGRILSRVPPRGQPHEFSAAISVD
jgi:hypothetical protein